MWSLTLGKEQKFYRSIKLIVFVSKSLCVCCTRVYILCFHLFCKESQLGLCLWPFLFIISQRTNFLVICKFDQQRFLFVFFFFPYQVLKGPKCNLCRTPSVTLLDGSGCLFTITIWNLSVSHLLIPLMLWLLYWFYIIWVPWSKYYVVLSQMPYINLSILHYHYYFNESSL